MRVVYVSSLPRGGPVSHLRILAPAVARAGADVHVLCLDDDVATSFRSAGVPASVTPLRHKGDLRGAARTGPLIAGADVVHTHDRRTGLLVRPPARLRGALVVHSFHGLPEEIAVQLGRGSKAPTPPGVSQARVAWLRLGYLGIESILSRFGYAVTPSRAMADFLGAHGLPRNRIHVVPNGIDIRPERTRERRADGALRLGVAANLEYHKGIDVLLEACSRMPAAPRLEVFGDGTWRGQLEEQARRLGVDAVFGGHVANVRERMEDWDLLVLPSRAENFPLAALEAMATKLPVVATRVGGVPEIVIDGETGLLVDADDADALAAALDRLSRDPGLRARLGEAGRNRVATEFDADMLAGRMLALYEELR